MLTLIKRMYEQVVRLGESIAENFFAANAQLLLPE
jgi:hypothetical protein